MPSWETIATFLSGLGIGSILSALVTYRLARAAKVQDARLEADRVLYKLAAEAFSDRTIYFLRQLSTSFPADEILPLDRFLWEWARPEKRFHDRRLERARGELHAAVKNLLVYVGQETFPVGDRTKVRVQGIPHEWQTTDRKRYTRVAHELGERADEVVKAHAKFIEVARRRLHI
jgi:hypothetical protein